MIKEFLEISKKVIIVTDPNADFDQFAGFIALAKFLRDEQKEVSLLFPKNTKTNLFLKLFPTEDIKVMDKTACDSFIVSLRKNGAVVKEVKWQEDQGKINIYVTTQKGDIDSENVNIKPNMNVFDAIILFGIEDLEKAKNYFALEDSFFNKGKTIQIGNLHKDQGAYKFNEVSDIYSVLVYKLAHDLGIKISGMIQTDLLSGILWKTKGLFRVSDKSVVEVICELSKSQANIKAAQDKAFRQNTMQDMQILDLVIKNLNINSDNVAYSVIHNAQTKGVNLDFIISSNWHQLDKLKNVDYGFVLFEYADHVKGLVFSSGIIDLNEILTEFKSHGDEYERYFQTDKKIEEVKELLLKAKKDNKSAPVEIIKGEKKQEEKKATKEEGETKTNYDPLAPANVLPDPLALEKLEDNDQKSGYNPPPPINPVN